jgi:hypothetical protein
VQQLRAVTSDHRQFADHVKPVVREACGRNFPMGFALLSAAALSGCAPAAVPKPNIEHMLAIAKTASDHEAIANYYDNEAAEAEVEYEEHQSAALRYYHGSPRARGWAWHCDRLAQDYKQANEDASVLAAQYRKIAEEIKSGFEVPTPLATPGPSAQQTQ